MRSPYCVQPPLLTKKYPVSICIEAFYSQILLPADVGVNFVRPRATNRPYIHR